MIKKTQKNTQKEKCHQESRNTGDSSSE
jgi:hypothetical protein